MNLICRNIWSSTSATATVKKQHRRQLEVCDDICQQIRNGSTAIAGIMAESFTEGTQKIISGQPLIYGQSITDPCLNWEDTEVLLKTCRGGRQPLLIARPSCRDGRFFDALPALFSPRAYITPQN